MHNAQDKIGNALNFLGVKTDQRRRYAIVASILAINTFSICELVLSESDSISGISVLVGVIVFFIFSISLTQKNQINNVLLKSNIEILNILFIIHFLFTVLLYSFIIVSYWNSFKSPS